MGDRGDVRAEKAGTSRDSRSGPRASSVKSRGGRLARGGGGAEGARWEWGGGGGGGHGAPFNVLTFLVPGPPAS